MKIKGWTVNRVGGSTTPKVVEYGRKYGQRRWDDRLDPASAVMTLPFLFPKGRKEGMK